MQYRKCDFLASHAALIVLLLAMATHFVSAALEQQVASSSHENLGLSHVPAVRHTH